MKDFVSIPTLFFMLFCFTAFAQENEQNIDAQINLETKDRLLSISGQAINNTSQEYHLRYKLSVITGNENNNNSSQNNQSGSFILPASNTKLLSITSISQDPGSHGIIQLQILNKDKILARDSLTFRF